MSIWHIIILEFYKKNSIHKNNIPNIIIFIVFIVLYNINIMYLWLILALNITFDITLLLSIYIQKENLKINENKEI